MIHITEVEYEIQYQRDGVWWMLVRGKDLEMMHRGAQSVGSHEYTTLRRRTLKITTSESAEVIEASEGPRLPRGEGCLACGLAEEGHGVRKSTGELYKGKANYASSVKCVLHGFVSQRNLPEDQKR